MKIIIGCEFSGVVRDALIAKGHNAWSCDLLPSEGHHIQGDILDHLDNYWDMGIFHPPCTYLCSSGLHWNHRTPGRQAKTDEALEFVRRLLDAPIPKIALENPTGCISTKIRKYDQRIQPWMFGDNASKGTCLWLKNLPRLQANDIIPPAGWQQVIYAMDLPLCPDCMEEAYCNIHEMHYGECSCIGPTQEEARYKVIEGIEFATINGPEKPVWANQTPSGQNKLGPSKDRWKLRSITYPGIAKAFAEQWGNLEGGAK